MDVKTLYVFEVHCTTTKKYDAKIGPQVLGVTPRTCGHWLLIERTTASRFETIFVWIGFAH